MRRVTAQPADDIDEYTYMQQSEATEADRQPQVHRIVSKQL